MADSDIQKFTEENFPSPIENLAGSWRKLLSSWRSIALITFVAFCANCLLILFFYGSFLYTLVKTILTGRLLWPGLLVFMGISSFIAAILSWQHASILYLLDGHNDLPKSLQLGLTRFLPLLLVYFLEFFLIALGAVFFLAPGAIFAIWFIFAQISAVCDRENGIQALYVSKRLADRYFGKIAVHILFLTCLNAAIAAIGLFIAPILPILLYAWNSFSLIYWHRLYRTLRPEHSEGAVALGA